MRIGISWYGSGNPSDVLRLRGPSGELLQFRSGAFISPAILAQLPASLAREIAAEGQLIDLDEAEEIAQTAQTNAAASQSMLRAALDAELRRRARVVRDELQRDPVADEIACMLEV